MTRELSYGRIKQLRVQRDSLNRPSAAAPRWPAPGGASPRIRSLKQRINRGKKDDFAGRSAEELIQGVAKEIIDLQARRTKAAAEDWAGTQNNACAAPWVEGPPVRRRGPLELAAIGDGLRSHRAGKGGEYAITHDFHDAAAS